MKFSLQFLDFKANISLTWSPKRVTWDDKPKTKPSRPKVVAMENSVQPSPESMPVKGTKSEKMMNIPGLGDFAIIAAAEDLDD